MSRYKWIWYYDLHLVKPEWIPFCNVKVVVEVKAGTGSSRYDLISHLIVIGSSSCTSPKAEWGSLESAETTSRQQNKPSHRDRVLCYPIPLYWKTYMQSSLDISASLNWTYSMTINGQNWQTDMQLLQSTTHKGLYRINHLLLGISSTCTIFQRVLEGLR